MSLELNGEASCRPFLYFTENWLHIYYPVRLKRSFSLVSPRFPLMTSYFLSRLS